MEAVGSDRTVIMAHGDVGPMRLLFARDQTQADQLWGTEALAAIYTPSRAGDRR